jgi:hypothetical protein
MKCTICKKEVILVPSASERAKKHGGKAADYTALFPSHPACFIRKYNEDSIALMRRIVAEQAANRVVLRPR